MINVKDNSWDYTLRIEFEKEYFKELHSKIKTDRRNGKIIYPVDWEIFRAFDLCPIYNVKVVIIGQDPYHNGDANGLAFGVKNTAKIPGSLRNIFKALKIDLNIKNELGDLSHWAIQGVLLLNSILTVEQNKPMSHVNIGWEIFTDEVIKILNESKAPIVWLLWGKKAQEKEEFITNKNHLIIKSSHPSPQSAHQGFLWHKPFSKTNNFLKKNGYLPIDWKLL